MLVQHLFTPLIQTGLKLATGQVAVKPLGHGIHPDDPPEDELEDELDEDELDVLG